MGMDKYNMAMPDLLEMVDKMTDWEKEFMETMARNYAGSGLYTIGQKRVLDKLITHYIDGVELPREAASKNGPRLFGNRIATQRSEGGHFVYVDKSRVGIPLTYKESTIVATYLQESIDDLERVLGAVVASQATVEADESFEVGGQGRF
jgi:hypothetical protein